MKPEQSAIGIAVSVVLGLLVGIAGSDGGESVGGVHIFLLSVIVAFAINWVAFIPSYLARTEHYFDLTGSLTYISLVALALATTDDLDTRTFVLGVLVLVWALRLGAFLFRRVKRDGSDGRFDEIKQDPLHFFMTWSLQGLWVSLTLAAALAAMTSGSKADFDVIGAIGLLIWAVGFAVEVISDRQKSAFRSDPENAGAFIDVGLWSWSRHPNYFGEVTLWLGIAILALPAFSGWQWVTLISPVFVFLLITRVSGVPMLEKRADKKWGGRADYDAYKAQTPVFLLRRPR